MIKNYREIQQFIMLQKLLSYFGGIKIKTLETPLNGYLEIWYRNGNTRWTQSTRIIRLEHSQRYSSPLFQS